MKNLIYILMLFYIVIATLTILFFDGTGDGGDSVMHYLFARYAPVHPELFFDHWAKPVYVLLASPFAQFGFTGVKVFNTLLSLITIFLTYKIALSLNIKNAIIAAVIMIFTPLYYILTFSGLTEPLFALVSAFGIYLVVKEKNLLACLVISFLPYVRSEGLIIIGVFAFYFLLKKQWKLLPLLLFGSLMYSIAGYFVYHDLLWVFNRIPYARLSSTYSSGGLFHFVTQLLYVVGIPIYILFWLGVISMMCNLFFRKIFFEEHILIFLGFMCFLIAHSLFWYFGIFNSMGLKRVLLCVMPMIAVIALQGFNLLTEDILKSKKTLQLAAGILLIAYIIVFPFTRNPAAINWKQDMMLSEDQHLAMGVADFIMNKKGKDFRILCSHPYLSEALHIDYFNKNKNLMLNDDNIAHIQQGDVIIWESWFAVVESGIKKETLDNNSALINIYNAKTTDRGRDISYALYEKK